MVVVYQTTTYPQNRKKTAEYLGGSCISEIGGEGIVREHHSLSTNAVHGISLTAEYRCKYPDFSVIGNRLSVIGQEFPKSP